MKSTAFFKRFYEIWDNTRRFHPLVWLAFHLAILVVFLLTAKVFINTDLYSILPDSNASRIVAKADKKMSGSAGASFYILVGNPDFGQAKAAAIRFRDSVKGHGGLEMLNLEVDARTLDSFQDYLFENRYRLLPESTRVALAHGDAESLQAAAFQTLSSPLAVGSLAIIDRDPFLLTQTSLQSFLGSGLLSSMAVAVKDDVLAVERDSQWWILLTGRVRGNGISTETEGHVVPALRAAAASITAATPSTRFVYSGVPFHAYDSASNAQNEIALISTISTILHNAIILLVFLSILPLGVTLVSLGMGILAGLAATFIVFHEVHIFTVVFGTTLIGVSIDYALYYFAEWLNPFAANDGRSIIRRILPGISLGLLTSVISFLVLCFVPFPLLQQMAIFSTVGLLSTFLSVLLLFPRFRPPRRLQKHRPLAKNLPVRLASGVLGWYSRWFASPAWLRWGCLVLLVAITGIGLSRLSFNNDPRAIYKVSPEMAANEKAAAQILQHGSTGMYFIIRGTSAEETRQREEALTARLVPAVTDKKLDNWLCSTMLLPSVARQEQNWRLVGTGLLPAVPSQMKLLDFDPAAIEKVTSEYRSQAGQYIDTDRFARLPFAALTGNLWIGKVDNEWFSAVLLMGVKDKQFLHGLEKSLPGVYLINKVEDITAVLQDLSRSALLIVVGAYLVIFFGLWWIYGLRDAIRISLVPAAASVITAGILGFTGLPFNLFAIVGLILVPGIGIDYAIFYKEGTSSSAVTLLAIFLTMLSNIMSFGLLGFSSLATVFGVSVTLGVAISFLLAPLTLPKSALPAHSPLSDAGDAGHDAIH